MKLRVIFRRLASCLRQSIEHKMDAWDVDAPFDPRLFREAYRPHTKANTPVFDLNGRRRVVRVVSIYDGDTLQFAMPLDDGKAWRFSARLVGIDACEMRSPDPDQKRQAVAARDRLVQLVAGPAAEGRSFDGPRDIERFLEADVHLIHVTCGRMDKYGRVLVTARAADGTDLARALLAEGLARPYVYSL